MAKAAVKAPKNTSVTVEMTFERSTKNKDVFVAAGEAIDTLYLAKSVFNGQPPKKITVTIE